MQQITRPMLMFAALLAALAGFVDALAFVALGGFFASFMSGNTTRLAVLLAGGTAGAWMVAAAVLLAFMAGVMAAGIAALRWPARQGLAVMALVTIILSLAAGVGTVSGPGVVILLLLAMAMGAENGVFTRDGEVRIGVTFFTGNLVRMAQRLTLALHGAGAHRDWWPYAALWLAFLAGALLSVQALAAWGLVAALWLAAGSAAVMAAGAGWGTQTTPKA